jgi:uncharacterized protein (TIGR03089 family)
VTVGALFIGTVARDPTRPLLTFYDDATGERTELSPATLGNWVAKTANMIVDDCGLGPGGRAVVSLPPHWLTAAILLGCWQAGLAVTIAPEPVDVAFVAARDAGTPISGPADRYAVNLHPLALPLQTPPAGYLDFTTEVRAHGDHFVAADPPVESTPAWRGADGADVSQRELYAGARDRAAALGIAGGRVLIDTDRFADPIDWLLAPLAAGASTVLCRNADQALLDERVAAERVTHVVS